MRNTNEYYKGTLSIYSSESCNEVFSWKYMGWKATRRYISEKSIQEIWRIFQQYERDVTTICGLVKYFTYNFRDELTAPRSTDGIWDVGNRQRCDESLLNATKPAYDGISSNKASKLVQWSKKQFSAVAHISAIVGNESHNRTSGGHCTRTNNPKMSYFCNKDELRLQRAEYPECVLVHHLNPFHQF